MGFEDESVVPGVRKGLWGVCGKSEGIAKEDDPHARR